MMMMMINSLAYVTEADLMDTSVSPTNIRSYFSLEASVPLADELIFPRRSVVL